MTRVANVARNILLGVLHEDEQNGVDIFVANAGIPLLHYGEGECIKAGFLYYHHQCFGIPITSISGGVKKEPVMIAGETMYYVYVQTVERVNVGVV